MRKLADIAPDDRRGRARTGPTCAERVKVTRSVPSSGGRCPVEPEPVETDTPIRGVHWSNEYATVGQRHATGSRAALDYAPASPWVPPHRVRSKARSRALARAKARD